MPKFTKPLALFAAGVSAVGGALIAIQKKGRELQEEVSVPDLDDEVDCIIPVDLPLEVWGDLALQAHERDMKLNDFLNEILQDEAAAVLAKRDMESKGVPKDP